jgi:hypothetical protein
LTMPDHLPCVDEVSLVRFWAFCEIEACRPTAPNPTFVSTGVANISVVPGSK